MAEATGEQALKKSSKSPLIIFVLIALFGFAGFFIFNKSNKPALVEPAEIKLGLNVELTGDLSAVGQSSKNGAELAVKLMNEKGGLTVMGKSYKISLNIQDNGGDLEKTKTVTQKLIDDQVLAIVGPNASKFAIAAAEVAEPGKILLLSPWSTNPKTTLNADGTHKKYIFRAGFIDPFQGQALAEFALNDLKFKKAAVMYDETADVLKGQSDFFQDTFKKMGGEVVATTAFKSGDTSFDQQLPEIKRTNPDVVFLPAYYKDAAVIINKAKALNINIPFLGSDAWEGNQILTECGNNCEGYYVSSHYAADSKSAITQEFVKNYALAYGSTPDDVAALTYDSFGLLFKAIENSGKIERQAIVDAMSKISDYTGVTGSMKFVSGSGDPMKSAVILQIKEGKFNFAANVTS